MQELNPNHPVTNELREQYHKLLAIVMWRFGMDRLVVTSEEIERFVKGHVDPAWMIGHSRRGTT